MKGGLESTTVLPQSPNMLGQQPALRGLASFLSSLTESPPPHTHTHHLGSPAPLCLCRYTHTHTQKPPAQEPLQSCPLLLPFLKEAGRPNLLSAFEVYLRRHNSAPCWRLPASHDYCSLDGLRLWHTEVRKPLVSERCLISLHIKSLHRRLMSSYLCRSRATTHTLSGPLYNCSDPTGFCIPTGLVRRLKT